MAVSSICLPEPLQHEDDRSWFKTFELCAAANEWIAAKQLLRLPTLLRGRSWAIYKLLSDADNESYDVLKKAILDRLDPDTDEHRLAARDQLSHRCLREGLENIDELTRDFEKLLDQASPGLPSATCEAELRFHLINSLPDNVAFQLKLQPQANYSATIAKARELQLIYSRNSSTANNFNSVRAEEGSRLDKVEQSLLQMTEQLAALSSHLTRPTQPPRLCYNCGRPGHLARNCYSRRTIQCFNCGMTGHVARDCQDQGNGQGGARIPRVGGTPRRLVSAHTTTHAPHTNTHAHSIPTITHSTHINRAAHTQGSLNGHTIMILLDSGASCSSQMFITHESSPCTQSD